VTIYRNKYLVGISQTSHTAHDTQNVVVDGIDTHLGSVGTLNSGVGENKLQSGVINTREVARAGGLVLLGSQCEGIQVDSGIGGASVVLVRLNQVEVGSLTLREAVLAVKLELSGDDGILTPAVHVKRGLGKNESAGIRDTGSGSRMSKVGQAVVGSVSSSVSKLPPRSSTGSSILSSSISEETGGVNVSTGIGSSSNNGVVRSECHNGVGQSINSVGVVEGLSTKEAVKNSSRLKRRAIVDVLVRLDNPDKLLNGVVEVKLDLVGRGTDGLITGELKLLDEVLVGVLGHTSTLISVQEHVVNVEGGSDEGLVVSGSDLHSSGTASDVGETGHSPQALLNRADIKVDLDLVVLKGDEGKGQTGVAAEPELKGDVEGGLRESIAGSANLARSVSIARAIDVVEGGISDEGKLGSVTDHLEVTALLLGRHGKLVPDVHPVSVLTVDALTTDLNLNLRDELLTGKVEPTGINASESVLQRLANLGESNLKVSAVSQITITRDGAGHAATEVSLAIESLLDRLHSEVSVTLVGNLPESNLGITSQVNVLGAIGDKLHKSSTHCKMLVILLKKKKKSPN
jgi:hypothetical protein